jgi:NAD-dependent SIR2 family protein deacetylase
MMDLDVAYQQVAEAIRSADALLIGAGAGMGVDSGLPDFRGPEGFWRAYPAFHGRRFADISNPVWFQRDPEQAWGFFGHRLNLYRATAPHAGFEILRRWGESRPAGCFVFTSNVDGHFHQAGFAPDRILDCHGSINFLQCVDGCTDAIWSAGETTVAVDEATVRARPPLPHCIHCGQLARPNILMFHDRTWNPNRSEQEMATRCACCCPVTKAT